MTPDLGRALLFIELLDSPLIESLDELLFNEVLLPRI